MSSKSQSQSQTSPTTPTQAAPWQNAMGKAKKASDFHDLWVGQSPVDMDPSLQGGKAEKLEQGDLVDQPMVVFGFSQREGEKRPFAVVSCVPEALGKVCVFLSSGEVILKKLRRIGAQNGFPVRCKLVQPAGKRYFDLIDA